MGFVAVDLLVSKMNIPLSLSGVDVLKCDAIVGKKGQVEVCVCDSFHLCLVVLHNPVTRLSECDRNVMQCNAIANIGILRTVHCTFFIKVAVHLIQNPMSKTPNYASSFNNPPHSTSA